jgi:hypothetical protein
VNNFIFFEQRSQRRNESAFWSGFWEALFNQGLKAIALAIFIP